MFYRYPVRVVLLAMMVLLIASCQQKRDSFFGRWTVEKVNVEFDVTKSTPEMVRQYGELEKGNVIEISKDSVLTFVSDGDTLRGKCSLEGTLLTCDGVAFGRYENRHIETRTTTALGEIIVSYRME